MSEARLERPVPAPGDVTEMTFGWWGMLAGIATEAALFVYILFTYYYLAVRQHTGPWPPEPMSLTLSLPNTIILIASSVAAWYGEHAAARAERGRTILGLAAAIALGIVFLAIQALEWADKTSTLASSTFGSIYYTATGFHMAHVAGGILILATLLAWTALGLIGGRRTAILSIGTIYWHFVDAVWLTIFFTFYLSPYFVGHAHA